ncbi:MAG TPA: glycoside hydrolase family 6 protein [Gemmatimonadaceae bacterium]|nr:glycoside hydrolase family 6 protein [Gemmatimonadaceae bacterium]
MSLYSLARTLMRAALPLSLLGTLLTIAACSDAGSFSPTAPDAIRIPGARLDSAGIVMPRLTLPNVASALVGAQLFVDPSSSAHVTADAWRTSRPTDAAQMDKIANEPQAVWFGNWNTDISAAVSAAMSAAAGAMPVFVAYNIPQRDCGGYSGGNSTAVGEYRTWIDGFARGIGAGRAAVILEPDALAGMDCLSAADQQTRLALLSYAVRAFTALGGTAVYIDAGNPRWQTPATMAARLAQAGIAEASGFSLNISNFYTDADNIAYGQQLSSLVGNKHFVIDASRNGLGPTPDNQWCNPDGRALGRRPTTSTGIDRLDAFLWIKTPGESDGTCNGAPAAGTWMPEYALGLAQRAAY